MANCAFDFALVNQEQCFVALENTCGTLAKPTSADRCYSVGPVDFSQERELLPDQQIRPAASQLPYIKARLTPGEWKMSTYVKPSGTPGTKPEHAKLFRAAFGLETPSGSKVDYTLENQLDSLSIWFKKGHTVFALRGATVEQAAFKVEGQSVAQVDWSGKFMERLWAGECPSDGTFGAGASQIKLASGGAVRYCNGMLVTIGTDDNSGAGYTISNVNYTNDTFGITPTLATSQGTNPTIYPFWPTSSAEVGEPAHGKLGLVTISSAQAIVLTANVTLTNNIKYYENEKNGVWTAERFARPLKRTIEGTITCYFLKAGLSYFYRADYRKFDALVIPVGNENGKIMEITIPYAQYKAPKITGTEEFEQELAFMAVSGGTYPYNDEMVVTFK